MNERKLRLLVVTQTVDKNDGVLGFFHRWIEVFSENFSSIKVVCLGKGAFDLPDNVSVFSLGKEEKELRIMNNELGKKARYGFRFVRQIVRMRNEYDAVFVHMNEEYVLLGGILWRLMGKKVMLWRNHKDGSFKTRLAVFLSHKVFCTSESSFTARYKKTVLMPVGIDTDFFDYNGEDDRKEILFLGRVAPIKRPHLFAESLVNLKNHGVEFTARIVGDHLSKDEVYSKEIIKSIDSAKLSDRVILERGVPYVETPKYYRRALIYVNLTFSGSLDKTIFEAMSSGALPLISNEYFKGKIDDMFVTRDEPKEIAEKLRNLLLLLDEQREDSRKSLRNFVEKEHSLKLLSERLVALVSTF